MHYVLHGYYGAGNIGDDAILESIIDSICLEDQNAHFTVISKGVKAAYKGPRKVSVIKANEVEKIRATIKSCDRFILGGGGILQDYSGWKPQNALGNKAKSMNYYSQFIDMAHAYKIPIYFYGIGIGPFKKKAAEKYAITLLRKGEKIAVRDPHSFEFVKKHIDNEKISLITDPAMCLKAVPPERRKQILKKEKLPSNYKLVGICLRPWFFKGKKEQELLKKIGQVGDELYKQYNVRFVLIPFSQYQGDITLMKRVKQYLPKGSSYIINPKNKSSKYIQGLCSSLSLMIGMRLHSLILAASQNVPVIGLSYDPKVSHFMRSIKQEQFLFPYNTVTDKQLLESAQLILNGEINQEDYISTIQNLKQNCLAKLSEV